MCNEEIDGDDRKSTKLMIRSAQNRQAELPILWCSGFLKPRGALAGISTASSLFDAFYAVAHFSDQFPKKYYLPEVECTIL